MRNKLIPLAFNGRQRGFSLVELMIGMLLSLILLGGLVLVFASSSEVNRNRQSMSLIADNARFALEHMNRQLRMADSIQFEGGNTLEIKLITTPSRTITYTLRGAEMYFNDGSGIGDSLLVDSIKKWNLSFLVNDSPKEVSETDQVDFSTNVFSVRVEMTMDDPSRSANNESKVSSTIALRNPLLTAYHDAKNETSDSKPSLPDPDEDLSTPEEPSETQPESDDSITDTEEQQTEEQPPVECTSVTVTAVAHHQDADYKGYVGSVSPNSFSGCAKVGHTNFACTGRAANQSGFSVTLNFAGPGNQKSSPTVKFSCKP